MDSKASWLSSRASSSRRDRLSNTSHELPRWRSPSPLAASMIPPPIFQSSYASPPPPSTIAKSTFFEQPSVSDTREEDMHADLQYILDAQAEALARGLSAGAAEGSTGSTTPTAASARSSVARAGSRTAQKKTMSLRKARKELYSKIMEFSRLKDEELEDLDAEAEQAARKLRQLESWGAKRKGLEEASSAVDKSEDTVRVQRLRREADTLRDSIFEVEAQLADMKGRHRKLARQIAAAENETQARLASYTQSMSLLEAEVQKFLAIGMPSSGPSPAQVEASNGHVSVWQLPPKRRTLEMAKDYFTEERDAVLSRRQRTEQEKEALVQGGLMWKDVAAAVTEFEKRVRAEMPGAEMANSGQAWDDTPQSSPTDRLKELLVHMDAVIENLQTKYNEAEEKHWKLLVAAIGAELEALRQGKQILQGVLGQAEPEQVLVGTEVEDKEVPTYGPDGLDSGDEIRGLDKSFETARRSRTSNGDTDDEPDPELLFSRNDTDTE
ncbi:hypothetical protein WHR41_03339 [Cladosporium halotolerans]|uniref:Autophagy-related protein 28 n=1 Tax=Cladosporium halotolerans TaxID=1052096 RepID=A0AB34KXF8_9PEZI